MEGGRRRRGRREETVLTMSWPRTGGRSQVDLLDHYGGNGCSRTRSTRGGMAGYRRRVVDMTPRLVGINL